MVRVLDIDVNDGTTSLVRHSTWDAAPAICPEHIFPGCSQPGVCERLAGLRVAACEGLLPLVSHASQQQVTQPRLSAPTRVRDLRGGQKGALKEGAETRFFLLVSTRVSPLLFVQGMVERKACIRVTVLVAMLAEMLEPTHLCPTCAKGRSLEEIMKDLPERQEMGVLTNGTE